MNLRNFIAKARTNLYGWRTDRKIVVFESDDWGSVRMPSLDIYNALLSKGIRVDLCPYNKYDSLENEDDLNFLYEVLRKFKDKNENHPVITANCVVANPDFAKIRNSGFEEYSFEKVTDTYQRFYSDEKPLTLIKQGIENKIFYPQFHGREHLNVNRWMSALREGYEETLFAFQYGVFGLSTNITNEKRKSYLAAFDVDSDLSDLGDKERILGDGLTLFEEIYGYQSETFIAPNYVWGNHLLPILKAKNVRFIQGNRMQIDPTTGLINHKLGETSSLGQKYLIRNATFEPTIVGRNSVVENCMNDIRWAFSFQKPAIISMHRLNLMGGIDVNNRDKNLKLLSELLNDITKKWNDVEFMTSSQLGEIMSNK